MPNRSFPRALLSVILTMAALTGSIGSVAAATYDVLIRNGTIYDGSGQSPRKADLAIQGDRIVSLGNLVKETAKTVVDAKGLAVAPGFINMLSWSNESLLVDGKGQSEVRQGVTTQILGEGWSWGPVNSAIKARALWGPGKQGL